MTIKADIEALERALERLDSASNGFAMQSRYEDFCTEATPEVIRRLLDERAEALAILRSALIDLQFSDEVAAEVSAFLRKVGHE